MTLSHPCRFAHLTLLTLSGAACSTIDIQLVSWLFDGKYFIGKLDVTILYWQKVFSAKTKWSCCNFSTNFCFVIVWVGHGFPFYNFQIKVQYNLQYCSIHRISGEVFCAPIPALAFEPHSEFRSVKYCCLTRYKL